MHTQLSLSIAVHTDCAETDCCVTLHTYYVEADLVAGCDLIFLHLSKLTSNVKMSTNTGISPKRRFTTRRALIKGLNVTDLRSSAQLSSLG